VWIPVVLIPLHLIRGSQALSEWLRNFGLSRMAQSGFGENFRRKLCLRPLASAGFHPTPATFVSSLCGVPEGKGCFIVESVGLEPSLEQFLNSWTMAVEPAIPKRNGTRRPMRSGGLTPKSKRRPRSAMRDGSSDTPQFRKMMPGCLFCSPLMLNSPCTMEYSRFSLSGSNRLNPE
jgi:hypothetical protein